MVSLGGACPQIEWNGKQYRAIPSGAKLGSPNETGGYAMEADMTLTLLVSDFANGPFPESTQLLSYPAYVKLYKIDTVKVMAGQKTFRIAVEDENQSL